MGVGDELMMKKELWHSLVVANVWLLFCGIFCCPSAAADDDRPNIIFILLDDVGTDWISCYGAKHQTPNIDRLAEQGVRFKTAWATPLCTPTCVEFLTGQYGFRTGWKVHHDVPARGGAGLDPAKFTTIARVLRDAGYATALCGKWQINDLRPDKEILAKHGFQEHCLWPGGESKNPPSESRYWDALIQTNGDRQVYEGKFGPDIVHEYAKAFVAKNTKQPFFFVLPDGLLPFPDRGHASPESGRYEERKGWRTSSQWNDDLC